MVRFQVIPDLDCQYDIVEPSQDQIQKWITWDKNDNEVRARINQLTLVNRHEEPINTAYGNIDLCSKCIAAVLSIHSMISSSQHPENGVNLGTDIGVYQKYKQDFQSFYYFDPRGIRRAGTISIETQELDYCMRHEGEHGKAAQAVGFGVLFGLAELKYNGTESGSLLDIAPTIIPLTRAYPRTVLYSLEKFINNRLIIVQAPQNGTGMSPDDDTAYGAWINILTDLQNNLPFSFETEVVPQSLDYLNAK